MAAKKQRPSRLGRGLSSLMATPVEVQPPASPDKPGDAGKQAHEGSQQPRASEAGEGSTQTHGDGLVHLAVQAIVPNRHQPRERFDDAAIQTLAESIAKQGLMQPIVVRSIAEEKDGVGDAGAAARYELIAGERRWRAVQLAGLQTVPALVREIDDQQSAEWALIENLQREDLNPIEKAEAFARLSEQFGLSHAEIADRVGLQRSSISNLLRLLDLSDFVRDLIREGLMSMGQARAIAGLEEPSQQRVVAEGAIREGWSVRRVEAEVRRLQQAVASAADRKPSSAGSTPSSASAALGDLEKQIGQQLGTRVKIKAGRKKGAGTLAIDFYSLDEFDALVSRLGVKTE